MALSYCDQEERNRIIEQYSQSDQTLQDLADTFHISKGTVTNIIKGYPYTNKSSYLERIQKETSEKLKAKILETIESLDGSNVIEHSFGIFKYIELSALAEHEETLLQELKRERLYFEMKAWEAFQQGKHLQFGYMAEMWQELTDLIQDNAKNPWRSAARKMNVYGKVHNLKFSYFAKE